MFFASSFLGLEASVADWSPRMACRCVVIQEVEEGEELKSKGRVSSRRCRTEMMFPMYAMGSFKPNSIARTILDTAGDPIWDSVRADARFEVIIIGPFLFFFLSFLGVWYGVLDLKVGIENRVLNSKLNFLIYAISVHLDQ